MIFDLDENDDVDGRYIKREVVVKKYLPRLIIEYPHPTCIIITPLQQPLTNQPPGCFLSSKLYLSLVNKSICGTFWIDNNSILEQNKKHTDKLMNSLLSQLSKYIHTKVVDQMKYNKPVLLFL